MKIAEYLVIDALRPFEPDLTRWSQSDEPRFFSSLAFLEDNTVPDPDTLYLATGEILQKHASDSYDDCHIVCFGEGEDQIPKSEQMQLILLRSDAQIFAVFNVLNRLFQDLWDWDAKLNTALLSGADAQTFIDLSEHLFTNPVVLLTNTLHVAGISRQIEVANPDILFMRANRYLPENMVQGITAKPYLKTSESFYTTGFYPPPNYINCTIVIRKYEPNPWNLNLICIYGVNQEPSHSDLILLDHLAEYILAAAMHQQELAARFSNRASTFLYSLLEDAVPSDEELSVSSSLLNLPLDAQYQLYVVSFPIPLESHSNYVLQNLEQFLPSSLKLIYHESVLILDQLSKGETGHAGHITTALQQLLPINNGYCGISQVFSDLRLLKKVFRLTKKTAEIGHLLRPGEMYYRFENYYADLLLSTAAQNTDLQLVYLQALDYLMEYDRQHKSDNMQLLRSLLLHERNITDVSREMHLHRNSVLYRVDKIEQILELSLDDPDVRLHLLLSFRALDLITKSHESSQ